MVSKRGHMSVEGHGGFAFHQLGRVQPLVSFSVLVRMVRGLDLRRIRCVQAAQSGSIRDACRNFHGIVLQSGI